MKTYRRKSLGSKLVLLVSVVLELLICQVTAHAALANAPWPMYGKNLYHTALSTVPVSGSVGLLRWKCQTGNAVNSSPAIGADGTVYVGSDDDYLYAINPDGTVKWKYQTGGFVYSSPAIDADTVYVGGLDNYLYAINSTNGTVKWKYQTGGAVYSPPAISSGSDGTVYFGSADKNLYAMDPAGDGAGNGKVKWKYPTGDIVYSSPAIGADGTIYFGSFDNYLYAITPGVAPTLKWRYQTTGTVYSSPAIGSDGAGTVYVGSDDYYLYAINPADGSLKWKYLTGSAVYASPAIGADGTVYVGSDDNYLYAIDPTGAGTLKWRYQTVGRIGYTSLAIGSDNTVYVGSEDNCLYAINNNTFKWKYQMGVGVSGNRYNSPAIGADGTVYIGSTDSSLYAVIIDTPPALSWTGEANYVSDGLDPEIGTTATPFTFRTKYANDNNFAPKSGYPRVHILKGTAEITGSPFAMSSVSGTNNFVAGATYTFSTTLTTGGSDYTYYFDAQDKWGAVATGSPLTPTTAPFVVSMTSIIPSNIYNSNPVATINISGIGFSSTSTVKLAKSGQSDIIATGISANSTQITCTLNLLGAVTGYWDVVISTGGAGSYLATFSNGFQYSAMTINSIKPRNGCNTVPLSVTNLSGAGFVSGSTIKISRAGQSSINASNINLVDSTKFTCTLDITGAATGYWDVIVATGTEVGALSVTLSRGLYVNIIGINSITPDRGYNNEPAFIANLSGAGFVSGTRVKLSKLGCSDIAATSENVLSASQITCTLRLLGATTGYWDVVVSTGGPGSAFATLEDEGYLIEIMAPKADLFAAKAFPVPFNAKFGSMTFDNLTPDATVKIFTIAGQLVRNVDDSAGNGKAFWDGKNDSGKPVASGIYIVLVKDANGTKKIKIAVEK